MGRLVRLRTWYVGFFTINGHLGFLALFYVLCTVPARGQGPALLVLPLAALAFNWVFQSYMFLVNDLFDMPFDRMAGKRLELEGFPRWAVYLTLAFLILAGLLIGLTANLKVALLVIIAYLLATAYSAPGIRLKSRRVWGFLCDSFMERPLPVLIIFALFRWISAEAIVFVILCGTLHPDMNHELMDYQDDVRSNTHTLATQLGKPRSEFLMRHLFYPLNIASIALLSVLVVTRVTSTLLGMTAAWLFVILVAGLVYLSRPLNSEVVTRTFQRFANLARTLYHSGMISFPIYYANVNFEGLITMVVALTLVSRNFLYLPLLVLFVISQYHYSGFYKILLRHFLDTGRSVFH